MKRAALVLLVVACTKHEEPQTSSVVPSSLPTVTATPSVTAAPVADAAPITTCTASFSCGMSHPGLGSHSRTTSVDLGTCMRSYVSESGPYDPTSPRNPPKPTVTKVAAADCDRLRDFASALGPADVRSASESARMDTEACGLTVTCTGEAAARFNVQRQTITGASRVEQTIRAVLGAAP